MDTTTHHVDLDPGLFRRLGRAAPPLGGLGEDLAVRHLVEEDGLTLVARNWQIRSGELRGELDVVAVDEPSALVVVCEVKTRRDAARFGGAVVAVTPRQQMRIRRLAGLFLREAALPYRRIRLDLVAIDVTRRPTLTHLEGAL